MVWRPSLRDDSRGQGYWHLSESMAHGQHDGLATLFAVLQVLRAPPAPQQSSRLCVKKDDGEPLLGIRIDRRPEQRRRDVGVEIGIAESDGEIGRFALLVAATGKLGVNALLDLVASAPAHRWIVAEPMLGHLRR